MDQLSLIWTTQDWAFYSHERLSFQLLSFRGPGKDSRDQRWFVKRQPNHLSRNICWVEIDLLSFHIDLLSWKALSLAFCEHNSGHFIFLVTARVDSDIASKRPTIKAWSVLSARQHEIRPVASESCPSFFILLQQYHPCKTDEWSGCAAAW